MPRGSKSARLYLRQRRRREAVWVILDHGREISTGAGKSDIVAAEKVLADYIGRKRRPHFGNGHPDQVLIADLLAERRSPRAENTSARYDRRRYKQAA